MNRALPQEVLDQIELEHQHFAAAPQAFFQAWKRGVNIAGAEWFGDGAREALPQQRRLLRDGGRLVAGRRPAQFVEPVAQIQTELRQ